MRKVLSGHPPEDATQRRLPQISLRAQKHLFKPVVLSSRAVSRNKSAGLGKQHVVSPAGYF